MKKKILSVLTVFTLIVIAIGAISVSAATEGIYTYEISGGEVVITDCSTSASGDIVIPDTLGGYPVTSIGYGAFEACSSLVRATIPDSVTSIGIRAFYNCSSLTSITIPEGVTSIVDSAFSGCSSLVSVAIPDSVTSIVDSAFSGCSSLDRVDISDIAAWCNISFNGSTSNPLYYAGNLYLNENLVTDLIIPDSVTSIDNYAFYGCSSLISVTIPDSVIGIGRCAFDGCSSLVSVTIPEGVTSIDDSAFYNCSSLVSVTIPDSVTSIGYSAFYGCSSLVSITIPEGVTSIGYSAFGGCSSLVSVTIPEGVTSIGDYAFMNCNRLNSVNISDVAAWCNISFNGSTSNPLYYAGNLYLNGNLVTDLIIPDSVSSIGSSAFYGCISLVSVTIPDSVTSIGNYAFEGCSSLVSATIPDSVTSIGSGAFRNCSSLVSVTIPDSVTSIGSYAFYGCSSLVSVTIPDSVTSIGDSAFRDCSSLVSVTIPDSVTSIGIRAFYGCSNLVSVTIPDSVTSIGNYAFMNCNRLNSVNISDVAAWCNISFNGSTSNPLYYAGNLYLNGNLVTDLTIPDSVNSISEYAFYGCSSLVSVSIGKGIELIPESAFYGCSNLKYVALPSQIKYIRNDAFNGCSKIETVFYTGSESQWNSIQFYSRNESLTNAKIVYNAVKKTYKFETNCENKLSDITAYAIFTMPTVKNGDATLTGWYDNASLSGEPVSYPYYGDATTLYAAWTDRTGKSFDDAFIAKADRQYTATIAESGQHVYFEFVPKLSKEYRFYTTGSKDTYGYLYDSNKNRITSDDDSGDGNNFYIAYTLTAGQTYYIVIKLYSGTGDFSFFIEEPVDYRINEITIKDMSGNNLQTIPTGIFLATVSFTNVSSSADTVIVLAQYTDSGIFNGLMYVQTEDIPTGSTIKLSIPVDNSSGNVAELKAFCLESFGSLVPMGNAVSFPVEQ